LPKLVIELQQFFIKLVQFQQFFLLLFVLVLVLVLQEFILFKQFVFLRIFKILGIQQFFIVEFEQPIFKLQPIVVRSVKFFLRFIQFIIQQQFVFQQ